VNYLSLILFAVTTAGTPGPNNIMIMASGANYGAKRSLPHVAGINVGFPLMVVAVGVGLGEVLHQWPVVYDTLRPIGACYLIYLAYKIATSPVDSEGSSGDARPMSFTQSALFQVVNPKAWIMVVGALATYTTAHNSYLLQVVTVAVIFLVFGTPCTVAWMFAGVAVKSASAKPLGFRIFNMTMAGLLVLSLIPTIGEIVDSW
jgi:threonine/homoserine/homoserine lactone efflux protein